MNAMSRSISLALLLLALSAATARAQWVAPPWAPTYSCQNGLNHFIDWLRVNPADRTLQFTLVTVEDPDPAAYFHPVTYVSGYLSLDAKGRLTGGGDLYDILPAGRTPALTGPDGRLQLTIDPAFPDRGVITDRSGSATFRLVRTGCYDGAILYGIVDWWTEREFIIAIHQVTIPQ